MNRRYPMTSPVTLETSQGSIPLKYSIEQVSEEPNAQVAATIKRMCEYVCFDCQSGPVRYDAQCALAIDPNDPLGSIHSFVRSRMRFVNDEETARPLEGMLPDRLARRHIGEMDSRIDPRTIL